MDYVEYYGPVIKMATGLIAIVNPIGAIPRFILLAGDRPGPEIKKMALKTTIGMVVTLLVFSMAGDWILKFFGISLSSFRVAGGILVLLIAISMLHAQPSKAKLLQEETEEAMGKEDFAIVPMAIPFLAGPGAISTVILNTHQMESLGQEIMLWLVILLTGLVVYLALRLADPIREKIGITGLNIATRLMGLILAAIAIEFITTGLGEIFPGLLAGKV